MPKSFVYAKKNLLLFIYKIGWKTKPMEECISLAYDSCATSRSKKGGHMAAAAYLAKAESFTHSEERKQSVKALQAAEWEGTAILLEGKLEMFGKRYDAAFNTAYNKRQEENPSLFSIVNAESGKTTWRNFIIQTMVDASNCRANSALFFAGISKKHANDVKNVEVENKWKEQASKAKKLLEKVKPLINATEDLSSDDLVLAYANMGARFLNKTLIQTCKEVAEMLAYIEQEYGRY